MKKSLISFAIALVALGITAHPALIGIARVSPLWAKGLSFEAEVTDISGTKYFPAVKDALAKAQKSIDMVMYQVILKPYDKTSQVYLLVDELVKARKRGVKVRVILDQNIDFVRGRGINRWAAEGKNSRCFKVLKDAGIDVRYDDLTGYTHAKALVIDNKIVIVGSANWSESALNKNIEVNTLIKSKELAGELLAFIGSIKTVSGPDSETRIFEEGIILSWRFLENPQLGGHMLTKNDERAFDLYLALLKEFDGNSEGKLALDYEKIASYLGLADKMTREGYRRQITRSLRKLKDDYKLIDLELHYDKDAQVRLLDYDNPKNPYSAPKEWYFYLPDGYWEYGWAGRLSFRAKFCYLINLANVNVSNNAPWWFSSREVLAKRFNVGEWVISKGMQELRILNLIDVAYDTPEGGSYNARLATSYKLMPLYDPAWLEAEWDRLEAAYGAKKLSEARNYAEIVFKQNDPQAVEDIILSIDNFGKDKVKKAFVIVAKKRIDNPKRCYEYVKATIDRMEDAEP